MIEYMFLCVKGGCMRHWTVDVGTSATDPAYTAHRALGVRFARRNA